VGVKDEQVCVGADEGYLVPEQRTARRPLQGRAEGSQGARKALR